jgi:hypothetical protein
MNIRQAVIEELPTILKIYDNARAYMREQGNATQWDGGYPQEEILRRDISEKKLYVCVENEEILAVFYYAFEDDPTYFKIYDGAWLNPLPYGVLHRIAVNSKGRGVAAFCYNYCLSQCKNLKIDTHRDNIPMQKSLAKNGFSYCGIIHLASGDERLAYQKAIL